MCCESECEQTCASHADVRHGVSNARVCMDGVGACVGTVYHGSSLVSGRDSETLSKKIICIFDDVINRHSIAYLKLHQWPVM